jgi:hypothetical protein
MHAIPKDASQSRFNAEFRRQMSQNYGQHEKIYTGGSVMENKPGFGVVFPNQINPIRSSDQTSSFHADSF